MLRRVREVMEFAHTRVYSRQSRHQRQSQAVLNSHRTRWDGEIQPPVLEKPADGRCDAERVHRILAVRIVVALPRLDAPGETSKTISGVKQA